MKKKDIAPVVEGEEIIVEKGFAGSHGNDHAHGKAGKWESIEEVDEWDWVLAWCRGGIGRRILM